MSTERKKREYMLTSHHDIIEEGMITQAYGLTRREGHNTSPSQQRCASRASKRSEKMKNMRTYRQYNQSSR